MPVIDTHAHIFPGDFGPPPHGCDPASWPRRSRIRTSTAASS